MKKQPSLIFCIVMDLIGSGSYVIPILGEFTDVIWAPLSAVIFLYTFGIKKGKAGSIFSFAEEICPELILYQRLPSCGYGNIFLKEKTM